MSHKSRLYFDVTCESKNSKGSSPDGKAGNICSFALLGVSLWNHHPSQRNAQRRQKNSFMDEFSRVEDLDNFPSKGIYHSLALTSR